MVLVVSCFSSRCRNVTQSDAKSPPSHDGVTAVWQQVSFRLELQTCDLCSAGGMLQPLSYNENWVKVNLVYIQ